MDRIEKEQKALEAIKAHLQGKKVIRDGGVIFGSEELGYFTQGTHFPTRQDLEKYLEGYHVINRHFIIMEPHEELENA
jgi:hypothetical protein